MDRKTGRSRCFGFIYFSSVEDAGRAKDNCNGMKLNGRSIRTDFSLTRKAHSPTPGHYMGRPQRRMDRGYPPRPRGYMRDRSPRDRSPRRYDPYYDDRRYEDRYDRYRERDRYDERDRY